MNKKLIGLTILAFVGIAAVVLFWGARTESVTISSVEGFAEGFLTDVIKAYGLDKKNGLNLTVVKTTAKEATRMVRDREVDAGVYNPLAAAKDNLAGKAIRIFAPYRWNVTSILTSPKSPIMSVYDLKGKRVGFVGDRTVAGYVDTQLVFSLLPMNLEADTRPIFVDNDNALLALLKRGEVDAVVLAEPRVSKLVADGELREIEKLRLIWQRKFGLPLPCNSLAAYEDWVLDHPRIVKKLNKTFLEAANLIVAEPKVFQDQKESLNRLGLISEQEIANFQINSLNIYPVRWGTEIVNDIQSLFERAVMLKFLDRLPDKTIIINPL